jgi:hypothetical protein
MIAGCREVILCIQCLHMSADRVLWFLRRNSAGVYTCAGSIHAGRRVCMRRGMHAPGVGMHAPGMRRERRSIMRQEYACAGSMHAPGYACRSMHAERRSMHAPGVLKCAGQYRMRRCKYAGPQRCSCAGYACARSMHAPGVCMRQAPGHHAPESCMRRRRRFMRRRCVGYACGESHARRELAMLRSMDDESRAGVRGRPYLRNCGSLTA